MSYNNKIYLACFVSDLKVKLLVRSQKRAALKKKIISIFTKTALKITLIVISVFNRKNG